MPEKKPSPRASGSKKPRSRATQPPVTDDIDHDLDDAPASSRPIAVGASSSSTTPPPPPQEEETAPWGDLGARTDAEPAFAVPEPADGTATTYDEPQPIERPGIELLTGLAALLMSLGTLLGTWYKTLLSPSVKGISSGNFGPIVFFLGLAVVAIVVLRAAKVPLAFPLETAWILEGIGWLCIALLFLKRSLIKPPGTQQVVTTGWLLAFVPAIVVALLGGYTSSHAPFVVRPGWQRSRAGKLGGGIIIVAVVAGLVMGFTVAPASIKAPPKAVVEKGTPKCGSTFPKPAGVTPVSGSGQKLPGRGTVCSMALTSTLKPAAIAARYKTALTKAGWKFTPGATTPQLVQLSLTSPLCGGVFAQTSATNKNGSIIQVSTYPCSLLRGR